MKTKASLSLCAIYSIVLLLLFLSACHFRKKIEQKAIVSQDIHALPLKLLDTPNTKTFFQPQPLRHAVALRKVDYYHQAYDELKAMLEGQKETNFERAVFLSENPYYGGRFSYKAFQNSISAKKMFIEKLIEANDQSDTIDFNVHVNENGRFKLADIRYLPHQKKELYRKALSNWAIFKYITDTVFIHTLKVKDSTLYTLYHSPYAYATADPFGMKDWSNSQVINLLISDDNKGNCFALTALYKILSDRLNTEAKICTAPQHIYIQHQDPKGQYYNVELATAGHPGDGIIQTLTYTPSEAIMSGIALRDYDSKQSIGLCLINLAKSYEHTFNTKDDEFMLHCAELALVHDSLNLNALLLKQQVLDIRVTKYATQHHLNSTIKLKQDKGIMPLVNKLEKHLFLLYQLGYREMPLDMQEQIINPFAYDTKKWNHVSQNARPFTSFEPKDPKDAEYWTLTKGMFKEVWEPTTKETYGHYTLTTATGKLKSIDTTSHKGQLIDPVAFAYDFGARMYDARIGHFVSVDPLQAKYPSLTPYGYAGNSPIVFIDVDGKYFDLNKLSKAEKREFLAHVQIQSAKDPYFKLMYQQFAASKNPYTVIINPKQQSPGAFLASNNGKGGTFTFSSLGGMKNSETINEEFFHAYQLNLYGKKKMDKIGGSNIEFEPKFLDAYKKVESGGLLTEQGGEEAAYKVVYSMDPEQKVLNSEQKTNYQSGVEDFRKHWAIKNKESKANNRYDDPTTSDGPDAVMDLINKVHTAGEKMPDSSVKIKAKK